MADFFDTGQVRDDDSYWDSLDRQIAENAARKSRENGIEWLAHSRAGWTAASLLVVAALAFTTLPSERWARDLSAEWGQSLGPIDSVGRAMILPDAPPSI